MNYKNSIYKYFNLKLDEINQLTIWIIYLFFISVIVVASCIFCNLFAEKFDFKWILWKILLYHQNFR